MNKLISLIVLLFIITACNSHKNQETTIDATEASDTTAIPKKITERSIHGELNTEKFNKYYPGISNAIKQIKTLGSEKIEMNPGNDIVVSLLHNTDTFNEMILCTHNKDQELIDYLYIGKATDFDNGKSKTIASDILNNSFIVFDKVAWGYVEKEIDVVNHERLTVNINPKGLISSSKKSMQDGSVLSFQKSFKTKNESAFLDQFPKNFELFSTYFGWNHKDNSPQVFSYGAIKYIDYWFDLLNTEEFEKYENQIIDICTNAEWDADGVSYFQHKAFTYIKEKKKYHLINELDDKKATSVLFFLFDGPHPEFDEGFASNLNPVKKKILNDLFTTGFYDNHENPDPISDPEDNWSTSYDITDFIGSEHYFIKNIDINNDGILDKAVSADPMQGNELFLFIRKNDTYEFVLKTINFSEDGGNQIVDIKQAKEGFVVITVFMGAGSSKAEYYISLVHKQWMLTNTVYKTKVSNQEKDAAFIYRCDVQQGLNISDPNFLENLKLLPEESERDKICVKEKIE